MEFIGTLQKVGFGRLYKVEFRASDVSAGYSILALIVRKSVSE